MAATLTIQIVGWNSAKPLPDTLKALKNIPLSEVIVRYIDNASTDNSVEIVHSLLPQADVIVLPTNMGYAKAHNIGFTKCVTPFVLTHDPDVEISWEGIKELLTEFEDEEVAAVQGKLYRKAKNTDGKLIIDSAGIVQTITLNGKERGAGEADDGQYNAPSNVLAVTGACGLYRMSALKKVAHGENEIFDNAFFAYKEDVDLGWRLKRAGFRCHFEPISMGTHVRTLGAGSSNNWGGSFNSFYKRLQSPRTRYSLRNYVWMIMKNASFLELLLHEVFIEARLLPFFVLSILYPPLFSVWREIWQGIPTALQKRSGSL